MPLLTLNNSLRWMKLFGPETKKVKRKIDSHTFIQTLCQYLRLLKGHPATIETTTDATESTSSQSQPTESTSSDSLLIPDTIISCDFTENLCGWSAETTETFQWRQTELASAAPANITAIPGSDG